MQTLIFDVDGVILRWNSRLLEYLDSVGLQNEEVSKKVKNNEFIDLEKTFYSGFLEEYHRSPFCRELHPFDTLAPEALLKLSKKYELVILTSYSSDPQAMENRLHNLELHYKDCFSHIEILPALSYKKDKLKELSEKRDIKYFIDDTPLHIQEGIEVLGKDKVIWFNSYNRNTNIFGVKIINTWEQLFNVLNENELEKPSKMKIKK